MTTAVLWYSFDAVLCFYFAVYLAGMRRRSTLLRGVVFDNLDNAACNDHFEPGEYLADASPDEIAYDMVLHADDCGEYTAPELTPYVREWLRKRGWTWEHGLPHC